MLGYQKNHHKRGFTIIEIILALLIISLVIVGVLMFFPTSRRATEESALKAKIANSVVSEIEVIKSKGYKSLNELLGSDNNLLIELSIKDGKIKINGNEVNLDPNSTINSTLNLSGWSSSLSNLGVDKGIIEINRVAGIDNLLSIKVRVEYGSEKNYEINTYISL